MKQCMRSYFVALLLPLICATTTVALAASPERFFESATWKDIPRVIQAKFPEIKIDQCAALQKQIYADKAVGCATHKLHGYSIGEIDFIVSFHFMKADQSLAEVSWFGLQHHAGEADGLSRMCETVQHAIGERYGVTELVIKESKNRVFNVPAYTATWQTPGRSSLFELDCIPMEGSEVIISVVVRPVAPDGRAQRSQRKSK